MLWGGVRLRNAKAELSYYRNCLEFMTEPKLLYDFCKIFDGGMMKQKLKYESYLANTQEIESIGESKSQLYDLDWLSNRTTFTEIALGIVNKMILDQPLLPVTLSNLILLEKCQEVCVKETIKVR